MGGAVSSSSKGGHCPRQEDVQDLIDQGYKLHWVNAGAGDKSGKLMFTIASHDASSSFVLSPQDPVAMSGPQVSVAVRTLNEIVASTGAPVPEMVKIAQRPMSERRRREDRGNQ